MNRTRALRYVWIVLFIALIAWLEGSQPVSRPEACAREIGVVWTWENGTTEKIEAFQDCVVERRK